MTANQIECFEAVAETLSFSKAAGLLYVSQPAISKSISHLEEEIGYPLFERDNNILTLTTAGELFRDYIARTKADYQSFLDQLEVLKLQASETIRVGCPEFWNPNHFSEWMEGCFHRVFPEGRLIIEAYKLSDLLLRLKSGKLDFVISHDFYTPSIPGLHAETLCETGMGILYAKGLFPEPVRIDDLARKGFLVFDDDIKKRFGALINTARQKDRSCSFVIGDSLPYNDTCNSIINDGYINSWIEGANHYTDNNHQIGMQTKAYTYKNKNVLTVELSYE